MSYIGLRTNKRNGENMQFKDAITFEFALDTSVPIQITSTIRLEDGNKILLEQLIVILYIQCKNYVRTLFILRSTVNVKQE